MICSRVVIESLRFLSAARQVSIFISLSPPVNVRQELRSSIYSNTFIKIAKRNHEAQLYIAKEWLRLTL